MHIHDAFVMMTILAKILYRCVPMLHIVGIMLRMSASIAETAYLQGNRASFILMLMQYGIAPHLLRSLHGCHVCQGAVTGTVYPPS